MESHGLYGCLAIYGIGCLAGATFVVFVLKETSGKSIGHVSSNERNANNSLAQIDDQRLHISAQGSKLNYNTFDSHNKQIA